MTVCLVIWLDQELVIVVKDVATPACSCLVLAPFVNLQCRWPQRSHSQLLSVILWWLITLFETIYDNQLSLFDQAQLNRNSSKCMARNESVSPSMYPELWNAHNSLFLKTFKVFPTTVSWLLDRWID